MNLALFYGIFPNRKDDATGWEPGSDQLISDTLQVLFQFYAARWEPVIYAYAEHSDVWLERFGEAASDKGLAFTVHNTADVTHTTVITIECAPLGLTHPEEVIITELVAEQSIPFSVVNEDIVLNLTLGPKDTQVLQIAAATEPDYGVYLPIIVKEWMWQVY